MSSSWKIKQTKNDGWFFDEEFKFEGIYPCDEDTWRKITTSLSTWSSWSDAKTNGERKEQIRKAFELEVDAMRERFEHDLKHNVRIYPLIGVKE